MRPAVVACAILFCGAVAMAALPPGFDEEIYCPHRMCLRPKRSGVVRKGFTGPRVMFLECFDPLTKETSRPRAWGAKLDQGYKDSLLRDKWHTEKCPEKEQRNDILREFLLLGSRVDSVIETLAILSFM